AGTEPVPPASVSGGFFQALGIKPAMGRTFLAEEEMQGSSHSVMLTYQAWQQRFGGSAGVVGQALRLSGGSYTVVGVLPADFQFAPQGAAEFWTLIDIKAPCEVRRACHNLDGVGRLEPGVTVSAALANLSAIAKRLEEQYPDSNAERGAGVTPFAEEVTANFRPIL